MGLGETIESLLKAYRNGRLARMPGPLGDFFRAGGNPHLLKGLILREEDVVLDVGGFAGDWTAEVLCRFGCRSIVLEPVPSFQHALRDRFGQNSRVTLVDAGLAARSGSVAMTIDGDGSSAFHAPRSSAETISVPMVGVADLWRERNIRRVACMKLNVEGAEYDVLDAMIDGRQLQDVDVLLIQFHQNVMGYEHRRRTIRSALSRSHENDLDYPFIWERWIRRP